MSTGCLTCFKVMCFKKKQSKKEDEPVKAEILPEPFGEKDKNEGEPLKTERLPEPVAKKNKDVKYSSCKKMPEECMFKPKPEYEGASHVSTNYLGPQVNDFYEDHHYAETDVSSSPMNNEFNKVKTFDIRGVTETAAK
ncbi:hypothetical protein CARUB_v10008019mg [Capsella rubella]|uniref:Uncharacterized protein n=1 Tax=Capsella rubella TaxID=81985 RepID=R0ETF6_9BRAS|nr:uncharacterized protein LOC17874266 [Capsella rubella]EOA12036.1 hypothetical protein CARUB_v10008019mg [Capsella rubella]